MFNDIDFVNARANEAVNEDFSTQRRVIEAFRRQVVKMDEHVQEQAQPMDKSEFNKIFISFKSTVDEYINKLDTDLESITSVPNLLYRYNLLANQLSAMGYNKTLNYKNKEDLNFDLNDIIPRLEELQRYADFYDFKDKETVDKIVNNFQTKQFKQITPSVKLSKISKQEIVGEEPFDVENVVDVAVGSEEEFNEAIGEINDYITGLTGVDSRFFSYEKDKINDFKRFRDIKKRFNSIKSKIKSKKGVIESVLTDANYKSIIDIKEELKVIDERVKDNEFNYNELKDELKQIKGDVRAKRLLLELNKSDSFDIELINDIMEFIRNYIPPDDEDLPPPPPPEIEQEGFSSADILSRFRPRQRTIAMSASPFGVQYNPEEGPADVMGLQPELD